MNETSDNSMEFSVKEYVVTEDEIKENRRVFVRIVDYLIEEIRDITKLHTEDQSLTLVGIRKLLKYAHEYERIVEIVESKTYWKFFSTKKSHWYLGGFLWKI